MSVADENLIFASDGVVVAELKGELIVDFEVDTWAQSETLEDLSFRVVGSNIYGLAHRGEESKTLLYPREGKLLVVRCIGAESYIARRGVVYQSSLRQVYAMRKNACCPHVNTLDEAQFDIRVAGIIIFLVRDGGDHKQESALHKFELAFSFSLDSETLATFELLKVGQVAPYGPSRGDLVFVREATSDVDYILSKNINDCHLK